MASIGSDNPFNPNSSFRERYTGDIESQLTSNSVSSNTQSNSIHAPSISSYNFSQIITAVRAAARSYNRLSKRVNNLSSQFSSMPTSVRSMKRAIQNARDSTKRYASVTRTLGNTVISARKAMQPLTSMGRAFQTAKNNTKRYASVAGTLGNSIISVRKSLQPLQGMQKVLREAKKSTKRYASVTKTLGNAIISARRRLQSDFSKKNLTASGIQKQTSNINVGRHVLNSVPAEIRTYSHDSYGKKLGRDLNATVPAMTLAEFIDHRLTHPKWVNPRLSKGQYVIGKAQIDYQRLHLNNPLRNLSSSMKSVLRPFQVASMKGSITPRSYMSAQNNVRHLFGDNGEYRQIARLINNRLKEMPIKKQQDIEKGLAKKLGLNSSLLGVGGLINTSLKSGSKAYNSVVKTAEGKNKATPAQVYTAQDYLKSSSKLEKLDVVIPKLQHELYALVTGINFVTSQMSGVNGSYMENHTKSLSFLPHVSRYRLSAEKQNSTGYNGKISHNPWSLHNPNKITERPRMSSLRGIFFASTKTLMYSAIPAIASQIKSNNDSGSQLRAQMGPQIYSQVLGNSINGGATPFKEDNTLERTMGQAAYHLGESMPQMTQNLQSLSGTRDTNSNDMTRAAINEGRFERANNVDSQTAQQLFGTLGQAGGLGSRGNQVNSNLSALSSQFSGMLNRDHLGAMGTQQAQGLNSIYGSMLSSGQTVTPSTAGNVMAMQSVLSHGSGGQVFQGQQGAQQLNAFSHGVGGAFNNQLIRNAFAGGMPQYGGQQGLYKLQMDMQEPLKHPTQLNNMIQGMSRIAGPTGAEDALTQMGLGPEAAKKIYRDAMSGQLTRSNLKHVQHRDRHKGESIQRRALRAYNKTGTSTVNKLSAIRQNTEAIASMMGDPVRRGMNAIEGPMSTNDGGSLLDTVFHTVGSLGINPVSIGSSILLGNIFRSKGLRALYKGFKSGHGIGNRIKNAKNAYKSAHGLGNTAKKASESASAGKSVNKNTSSVIKQGSHVNRFIKEHPIVSRFERNHPTLAHGGSSLSRAGRSITGTKAGRFLRFAGRHAKGLGFAGDALTALTDLRGINTRNIGNKLGGTAGDLWGGAAGASEGATYGAALGSVVPGLGNAVGAVGGGLLGGITGGSLGHWVGSHFGNLFDPHGHTAHAATLRRGQRGRSPLYTTYYWLVRINRLLPALAKKMSGFSDVDPSLAGNTSSSASSKMNNGDTNPNKQSNTKPGTSNTPSGPSTNSGAKSYNGTGNSGVNAQDAAATIEPAQVSSNYFDAVLGTTKNSDDHSTHEDSHNVYKNYINAPSQDYLSKLMENSQKAQSYFSHTHRTEWA